MAMSFKDAMGIGKKFQQPVEYDTFSEAQKANPPANSAVKPEVKSPATAQPPQPAEGKRRGRRANR